MQKRVGVRGPGAFRSTENPNIDAYVYQAALLCRDCAVATMNEFELHNMFCGSTCGLAAWPHSWQESDYYPQGPYANGGGEADSPQHCDACGVFLENPLTPDGTRYVRSSSTLATAVGAPRSLCNGLITIMPTSSSQAASPFRISSSSRRSTMTT